MLKNFRISSLLIVFTCFLFSINASAEEPVHALALHGNPKYDESFTHFDYTNPDAPKGGTLRLGVVSGSGFDSLNPFVIKGVPAAGLGYLFSSLFYDALTVHSVEEPFSVYGLVAETMEIPEDRSWIIFHINPKAYFHDGHPITAYDVEFTFNLLIEKGSPMYASYFHNVEKVEVLDEYSVKFSFDTKNNKELPLIIGELPILPKHFWEHRQFNASLEMPLGSGPYRIKEVDPGRSIMYERADDYWAKDLPVNKGSYNFDAISYDYYLDENVALEAFKAGEFDFRQERTAKTWATAYTGPQFNQGKIVTKEIPHEIPAGMQAFAMNLRRQPFDDIRVRKALNYAFDFEWTNKNIFVDAYTRTTSYFANSDLASTGLPSAEELKILEPYRDQLPAELFTQSFTLPQTKGDGNNRAQLREATQLLKEAGWEVQNGKLTNQQTGKVMSFEIIVPQADENFVRIVLPYIKNLQRLGIEAAFRVIDTQQYIARINDFDYDMTVVSIGQSDSPGNEQRDFWSSKEADNPGSRNYMGIKNPVIDDLINLIIGAPDREQLVTRTHALDRVLLWNYYVVPQWHNSVFRVAYWNKFDQPEISPKNALGITTWWSRSAE